jgi:uncharacterized RDD family membrane protein YckC
LGGNQVEPNESTIWFYIRDHQQQGPIGLFELNKLFEHRVLTGETYIWMKDMDYWQMAKTLDLFPDSITTPNEEVPRNSTSEWEERKKEIYPTGRPIIRYLARLFDLSLFSLILITLVSIFKPQFIMESSAIFIFMLSLILYILVESAILTIFGNTLGKSLLNTHLKTVDGERIHFLTALKRSIFVSAAGMGFGIPIINFICFCFSYFNLKKNGNTTWDKQIGTVVLYGEVGLGRILFVSLFPVSLLIAGFIIH